MTLKYFRSCEIACKGQRKRRFLLLCKFYFLKFQNPTLSPTSSTLPRSPPPHPKQPIAHSTSLFVTKSIDSIDSMIAEEETQSTYKVKYTFYSIYDSILSILIVSKREVLCHYEY